MFEEGNIIQKAEALATGVEIGIGIENSQAGRQQTTTKVPMTMLVVMGSRT